MNSATEVAVTLAPELFKRLRAESRKLGVSIEWLVASLVVDTIDNDALAARPRLIPLVHLAAAADLLATTSRGPGRSGRKPTERSSLW